MPAALREQERARRPLGSHRPIEASVVVPNSDRRDALVACLLALDRQRMDRFEVILVDNGSRDDSVAKAREILSDIRTIVRDRPLGFAAAANLGIAAARGAYVAVLNNDAEPDPEWLESVLLALERERTFGFAASRVVRRDRPDILDSFGEGLSLSCFPFQVGNGVSADEHFLEPLEVLGAPATAAVYRRELLRDVGGYDESFGSYLEDLDLSLRAQLRGWRCIAIPEARVRHAGHLTTGGSRNGQVVRLLGRNWVQMLTKSVPSRVLRRTCPGASVTLARQLVRHGLKSRHPLQYLLGLAEGVSRARALLVKRASTMAGRRVADDRLLELLASSSELLRFTRAHRVKAV
jgi:GT2 family glycosyltransferase